MKKKIADKWIKALRSGKYEQTENALCKDGKYCCLGVLCELAAKEKVCKISKPDSNNIVSFDDNFGLIPRSVAWWSGMKSRDGKRKGKRKELADLNDYSGYSFKRIANIIEKEYKDL